MTVQTYSAMVERFRRQWGEKFDPSSLEEVAPSIRRFYGEETRVIVERTYSDGSTHRRAGRISVTTGWRPAFLLVRRSSDMGSSDVLSADDRITAVQYGRRYYPVTPSGSIIPGAAPVAAPRGDEFIAATEEQN